MQWHLALAYINIQVFKYILKNYCVFFFPAFSSRVSCLFFLCLFFFFNYFFFILNSFLYILIYFNSYLRYAWIYKLCLFQWVLVILFLCDSSFAMYLLVKILSMRIHQWWMMLFKLTLLILAVSWFFFFFLVYFWCTLFPVPYQTP